jgi:hypothetical protein
MTELQRRGGVCCIGETEDCFIYRGGFMVLKTPKPGTSAPSEDFENREQERDREEKKVKDHYEIEHLQLNFKSEI